MKNVKILFAALLITTTFGAIAQDKQATKVKPTTKAPVTLTEHKCNNQCTAAGHNYVHGEKGHTCTAACKKTDAKKVN